MARGTRERLTTPAFESMPLPGLAAVTDRVTAWGDFDNDGLFRIQRPVVTRMERRPEGALRLEFTGAIPVYHIEAVTALPVDAQKPWLPLGDATEVVPGRYELIEIGATNLSGRFYRIVWTGT